MKPLKRMRYYTMNSWNRSTAPAYNLKVYNVINKELQNKVFELMESEEFYFNINQLIKLFNIVHDFKYQAGFNGTSGGYLVLYKGGRRENGQVFCYPGQGIDINDVPVEVLKSFRKLAIDIVKETEYMAKHCNIEEETYTVEKTRKIIK